MLRFTRLVAFGCLGVWAVIVAVSCVVPITVGSNINGLLIRGLSIDKASARFTSNRYGTSNEMWWVKGRYGRYGLFLEQSEPVLPPVLYREPPAVTHPWLGLIRWNVAVGELRRDIILVQRLGQGGRRKVADGFLVLPASVGSTFVLGQIPNFVLAGLWCVLAVRQVSRIRLSIEHSKRWLIGVLWLLLTTWVSVFVYSFSSGWTIGATFSDGLEVERGTGMGFSDGMISLQYKPVTLRQTSFRVGVQPWRSIFKTIWANSSNIGGEKNPFYDTAQRQRYWGDLRVGGLSPFASDGWLPLGSARNQVTLGIYPNTTLAILWLLWTIRLVRARWFHAPRGFEVVPKSTAAHANGVGRIKPASHAK
jgi:hypothetical protein